MNRPYCPDWGTPMEIAAVVEGAIPPGEGRWIILCYPCKLGSAWVQTDHLFWWIYRGIPCPDQQYLQQEMAALAAAVTNGSQNDN